MNHFEFHQCLTEKDQLFINLKAEVKALFDIVPVTFVLDFSNRDMVELEQF